MLLIFSPVRKKEELFISRLQYISIKCLCYIINQLGVQNSNQRDSIADKIDPCLVVNKYDIYTKLDIYNGSNTRYIIYNKGQDGVL